MAEDYKVVEELRHDATGYLVALLTCTYAPAGSNWLVEVYPPVAINGPVAIAFGSSRADVLNVALGLIATAAKTPSPTVH